VCAHLPLLHVQSFYTQLKRCFDTNYVISISFRRFSSGAKIDLIICVCFEFVHISVRMMKLERRSDMELAGYCTKEITRSVHL